MDRTTGVGQAILENVGAARVGIIIHADHFSEGASDEEHILWNNYYEYVFSQHRHIDFYIASTDEQNRLVEEQFQKYMGVTPNVVTIPAGSLEKLRYPAGERRAHSLITASRLAGEKHIDWLVDAVAAARESIPDLTLDIYGKGKEEENLRRQIDEKGASSYIRLMGQQDLTDVYQDYEAYLSGSTSEGFGLTLLEAVGAGLPIIGFDVRYGNRTFIDDGENGYRIPANDGMDVRKRVSELADRIIRLFTEADLEAFHRHSYERAEEYLTVEVEKRWREVLE
jgi:accessory Sec system glycosylation protein GtfA